MTDRSQEGTDIHHDVKQWQHCSLFNLDLFNDERHHVNTAKDTTHNTNIDGCCCSSSTPNVDDAQGRKHLNHSCSFAVLQKNYTTHLEHVAEKLLANEYKNLSDCSCCELDSSDNKGQSLNRKILLGSTALLDNFLRNNLKTPLIISSNHPSSCSASSTAATSATTTSVHISSTVTASTSNQRRWHSERGSRHPNVRANLPLTNAQRQVLERYINYPIIKPPVNIRSNRRSHHQPIMGKVGDNTGTALAALAEQPLLPLHPTSTVYLRKDSAPASTIHVRPLSSTSSSTSGVSHHSALNRRCFLADTIVHSNQTAEDSEVEDDDDDSISSELDQTSDEESSELLEESSVFVNTSSNLHLTHSETSAECGICNELKRLQKRSCCEFSACSICLNMYVEEQIKQGIIRIQCPNQKCHIYMHRDEIHKRCLSPELRQKFARFLLETNRSLNMKTCPRCSSIHEIGLAKQRIVFFGIQRILLFRSRTMSIDATRTDESAMRGV